MSLYIPIELDVELQEQQIELDVEVQEQQIELYFSEINVATYEEYKGEYIAIPKTTSQSFDTKNKLMKNDFLVTEIPYDETHNEFGITAVIAS